jgi:predicted nucleic acid-binding protein
MSQTSLSIPSFSANCDSGSSSFPKGRKRTALERWFDTGVGRLHCLPWDAETGLKWAELLAQLRTTGKAMPIKDSLIAATAVVHGMSVVTRNRADFVNAGVRIVDPFVG